jgi:hypothetical protein
MLKKIIKIVALVLCIFIIGINIPITYIGNQISTNDYSNWMNESIDGNPKLVDVKMLGAHDAFSSEINFLSEVDPYASGIFKGVPGVLLKGLLVRQAVTQNANVNELLSSGVRYLDIRLTYKDNEWYTKHNYLAEQFEPIGENLVRYLDEYSGEFLILDFQHIDGIDYDSKEDYVIFEEMLERIGLLSYNYVSETKSLGDIRYLEITNNKTESKVIIIDKFTCEEKKTYYYETSIYSNWANNDDFESVFAFLQEDSVQVANDKNHEGSFKVMQAVTTMQSTPSGLIDGLRTWSLLNRASGFNDFLIFQEDFEEILNQLPIVMVDYSNTNENEFLDRIMEIIIMENENQSEI